ncbi:unnamed protein product [Calypogeia fissa]
MNDDTALTRIYTQIAEISSSATNSESYHLQSTNTGLVIERKIQRDPIMPAEKTPTSVTEVHINASTDFSIPKAEMDSMPKAETDSIPENNAAVEETEMEIFERLKTLTTLTRKEIAEDFLVMGAELPKRPKRGRKTVERNLEQLRPGTGLCAVTRKRYAVNPAVKEKKSCGCGLKAMMETVGRNSE